jgi:hypothetical protein
MLEISLKMFLQSSWGKPEICVTGKYLKCSTFVLLEALLQTKTDRTDFAKFGRAYFSHYNSFACVHILGPGFMPGRLETTRSNQVKKNTSQCELVAIPRIFGLFPATATRFFHLGLKGAKLTKSAISFKNLEWEDEVKTTRYRMHCNENPIYVVLFWELRSLNPNFHIHVSASDLYIPRICPHISCIRIGRSIMGIFKSLTDT